MTKDAKQRINWAALPLNLRAPGLAHLSRNGLLSYRTVREPIWTHTLGIPGMLRLSNGDNSSARALALNHPCVLPQLHFATHTRCRVILKGNLDSGFEQIARSPLS